MQPSGESGYRPLTTRRIGQAPPSTVVPYSMMRASEKDKEAGEDGPLQAEHRHQDARRDRKHQPQHEPASADERLCNYRKSSWRNVLRRISDAMS